MTDEQIIKALECCHSELGNMCSICPLFDPDNDYCEDELHKNALNLINCQKAENEREINQIKSEAIREFAERLKSRLANLSVQTKTYGRKTMPNYVDDIANQILHDVALQEIDNLVKEMTRSDDE